jgi:hypothetical protein
VGDPAFRDAPTYAGDTFSSILEARITDVDTRRYTVTAVTEGSGRTYPDLPIATFYAHHERGEGGYVLPDVGATCWIATPGDSGTAFVLAFRNVPKAISSSERIGQPPAEGDEVMADHSMKRPQRLHGEFGWTTRDGSFIHYRKGGIVEIGSKASCQRLYIPLGNFIRDICENYGQFTAAGMQYFDGGRTEGEDGTTSEAKWRLMAKAHAADSMASVLVDAGIVDGKRFRIVVAPTAIRFGDETWDVSSEKYHFYVDADGNIDEKGAKISMEYTQYDLTVLGNKTETVTGGDSKESVTTGEKWISALKLRLTATVGGIDLVGATRVDGTLMATGALTVPSVSIPGFGYNIDLAWLAWLMLHVHVLNPATPLVTNTPTPPPP